MVEMRIMADGLRFPEGPVAMADGSVILGEIARAAVTRIARDGSKSSIGQAGGGRATATMAGSTTRCPTGRGSASSSTRC